MDELEKMEYNEQRALDIIKDPNAQWVLVALHSSVSIEQEDRRMGFNEVACIQHIKVQNDQKQGVITIAKSLIDAGMTIFDSVFFEDYGIVAQYKQKGEKHELD